MALSALLSLAVSTPAFASQKGDYFLFEDQDQPTREEVAVPTARGLPSEEPKFLWQQAKSTFRRGMYLDSKRFLERLIARHPATAGGLDAHFILGLTYLRLKEWKSAIEPLKTYVQHQTGQPKEFQGRLRLAEAYLESKMPHEAYLTVDGVVGNHRTKRRLSKAMQLEALTLKARAQLSMGQLEYAQRTYTAFKDQSIGTLRRLKNVRAAGKAVGLDIHLRHCSRFASSDQLDEGAVIDQMARRGLCLQEGLLMVNEIIEEKSAKSTRRAFSLIVQGSELYWDACQRPPRPPRRLAWAKLKRYQAELADRLIEDCLKTKETMVSLVDTWIKQPLSKNRSTFKRLKTKVSAAMTQKPVKPPVQRRAISSRF